MSYFSDLKDTIELQVALSMESRALIEATSEVATWEAASFHANGQNMRSFEHRHLLAFSDIRKAVAKMNAALAAYDAANATEIVPAAVEPAIADRIAARLLNERRAA